MVVAHKLSVENESVKRTSVKDGDAYRSGKKLIVAQGSGVLRKEARALFDFAQKLDQTNSELHAAFTATVRILVRRTGSQTQKSKNTSPRTTSHLGRVIVTGMGKSGHVAQKIAATFTSTGTPAMFVHPAEASHGDLGMVSSKDVVIAISNSGKTRELNDIVSYATRFNIPLIAITSKSESPLAQAAKIKLVLPAHQEACIYGLAPTTSTTLTIALGDALAVSAMSLRGFSAKDFGDFHPGGKLGLQFQRVGDIMHVGHEIPLVAQSTRMSQVVVEMAKDGFGCAGVCNAPGKLVGIITDGDLRRHMDDSNLFKKTAREVMSRNPVTVGRSLLTAEALRIIEERKVSQLFVVEQKRPIGILHVHDLLRAHAA